MKTHLVLFLCLSVLLSGCITMTTDVFKPEPDGAGDLVVRVSGGYFNIGFGFVTGLFLGYTLDPEGTVPSGTLVPGPPPWSLWAGLGLTIGLIAIDVAGRNTLPYRKAYYEMKKEAAQKAKEAEPSEVVE